MLKDPAPQVFLKGLGDSSVDWQVRIWVAAADFWPVKEAATRAVKVALDEAWDISYPGGNVPFSVAADTDTVTMTFDPVTTEVGVEVGVVENDEGRLAT